jgi:Ni/Co efflux regulator RcnB
MTLRFMTSRLSRIAVVPVLVAAMGAGIAQAQYGRDDHNHDDHGKDFHFRDEDRGHFSSHYNKDVDHWKSHPQGRPHFVRGEHIPAGYRFQPVPHAYYSNVPPPPPGYQYGYYDGYVVAYNPTTQIIADVLDLVAR